MQPVNIDNIAAIVRGPRGLPGEVSDADLAALLGGVDPAGNTLAKLYALILARATLNQIAAFTVSPTVPTLANGNNSTKVANSAFVRQELVNYAIALASLSTDGTFAANSDALVPSQKATATYVNTRVAALDVMVFKGVIDCSANPNYPAADAGWTYRISVAGRIGGASGAKVEAGDMAICITDGTGSGNQATVGANWDIIQANIDGAVVGPASAVDATPAVFDGVTGKLIKNVSFAAFKSALAIAVADITDASANGRSLISAANYAAMKILLSLDNVPNVDMTNVGNAVSGILAVARGGTGINSLGTGVASALGATLNATGGLVTFNGTMGAATIGSINGNIWTAGTGTLTFGAGKVLTISNTLTLTGTDGSSVAFGAGGTVAYTSNKLSAFAATTSAELAGVISDETGSGALVFGTSPTIATPVINGLPTGTGVATANTASTLVARDASGNFSAGTITAALAGNAATATAATAAINTAITDDIATNATVYPTWAPAATGNQPQKTSSTKLSFNPSTGNLSATTFGNIALSTSGVGSAALQIGSGKSLGFNNSLTINGGDGTTQTLPTTSATIARTDAAQTFTGVQTFSSTIAGSVSGNAGSATTLATSRNIDGQAFDGSAAITVIAPGTHAATSKATPVDADELPLVDSAASNVLKRLTWANLKATLKTYFDTLYAALDNSAWTAYTPTITSTGGTVTGATITTSGRYKQIGKTVFLQVSVTLTNIGSGSPTGAVQASLPVGLNPSASFPFNGSTVATNNGKSGYAFVSSAGTDVKAQDSTGTSFWINGYALVMGVTYEVP